jgi:hypothetical protein
MTSQYIASAVWVLQQKSKEMGVCNPAIYQNLVEAQIFLDALGFVPNLEQTEQARGKSIEGLLGDVFSEDAILNMHLQTEKCTKAGYYLVVHDLNGFYQSMRKVQYYYNEYKAHAKTD